MRHSGVPAAAVLRAIGVTLALLHGARAVSAQTPARLSLAPAGPQVELRLEGIAARTAALQAGVGVYVPAGRYVRLGGVAAAGAAWRDGAPRTSARVDGIAHFLLDPFRESRLALYGIGGVSLMYDGFEHTRPNLVVGIGVEGTPRRGRVAAFELALGGGVRAAVVVRRARPAGR
jgi:hypothetical protein